MTTITGSSPEKNGVQNRKSRSICTVLLQVHMSGSVTFQNGRLCGKVISSVSILQPLLVAQRCRLISRREIRRCSNCCSMVILLVNFRPGSGQLSVTLSGENIQSRLGHACARPVVPPRGWSFGKISPDFGWFDQGKFALASW